jgi:hypothetical protein
MQIPKKISGRSDGQKVAVGLARWCALVSSCVLSTCTIGCAAAYNARHDFAPDSRDSVDCYIRGAFGRQYYRETGKKVMVRIYSHGPNDKALLEQDEHNQMASGALVAHDISGLETQLSYEKEYQLKGSDVSWRSVWGSHNSLTLVFYDYGRDVAGPLSSLEPATQRSLLTLHFMLDPATGNYGETTASEK